MICRCMTVTDTDCGSAHRILYVRTCLSQHLYHILSQKSVVIAFILHSGRNAYSDYRYACRRTVKTVPVASGTAGRYAGIRDLYASAKVLRLTARKAVYRYNIVRFYLLRTEYCVTDAVYTGICRNIRPYYRHIPYSVRIVHFSMKCEVASTLPAVLQPRLSDATDGFPSPVTRHFPSGRSLLSTVHSAWI